MDFTKHKEVQQKCESKSEYFTRLDFPIIAKQFSEAANSIKELIEVLEQVASAGEEGGNG